MADTEWFVGEDGTLSVGKPTHSVTYHSGLNTILVSTKEPSVNVIDVTSGSVLQKSDLSASKSGNVTCTFLPSTKDRVLFCDGNVLSVRKDLNGVLLLDTALQTPVSKTEEDIKLELPLPEANSLYKCLLSAELQGVEYVEDVIRELEKEIEAVQQATKGNHKVAKWAVVVLHIPHVALRTVCSSLVSELKRLHQHVPGLPVAAAITDRLSALLPGAGEHGGASGGVERSMMYSEAARRETFARWPHMKYKWALPDPMAQAGFYHQPTSNGDDRAMCFTCNVCLVCWEPTDEPWSEHERHSPTCPFVKGEWTQNVPLSVSFATEPGQFHGSRSDQIECTSTTSSNHLIATSTLHGNVVVWDFTRQLKKHVQFNIDPWEPTVAAKTGTQVVTSSGETAQPATAATTWTDTTILHASTTAAQDSDSSDDESDGFHVSNAAEDTVDSTVEVPPPTTTKAADEAAVEEAMEDEEDDDDEDDDEDDDDEDDDSKMEVIEVGGAWKSMLPVKDSPPMPPQPQTDASILEDLEVVELDIDVGSVQEPQKRCRPSQDVLVSALCVLASPAPSDPTLGARSRPLPGLLSGVAIRRSTLALNDLHLLQPSTSTAAATAEEVQALNQVNQALSGSSSPQIIPSEKSKPTNPFVPYLLVHDVSQAKSSVRDKPHARKDHSHHHHHHHTTSNSISATSPVPNNYPLHSISISSQQQYYPTSNSQMYSFSQQNSYPTEGGVMLDEADVQLLGISPPPGNMEGGISGIKFGGSSGIKFGSVTSPMVDSTKSKTQTPKSAPVKQQSTSSEPISSGVPDKEGSVVQCLELPSCVDSNQYVHSITPTLDGKYVLVVTAPKCLNRKIYMASTNQSEETIIEEDEEEEDTADLLSPEDKHGCLIVYQVNMLGSMCKLNESPVQMLELQDSVVEVLMLPKELSHSMDEEEGASSASSTSVSVAPSPHEPELTEDSKTGPSVVSRSEAGGVVEGYIALTTSSGNVEIRKLSDFQLLATIKSTDGDNIVSAAYCGSMDRLCCATEEGKLHFYVLHPKPSHIDDADMTSFYAALRPTSAAMSANSSKEEVMDTEQQQQQQSQPEELLVKQSLSVSTLDALHSLTQFENLVPRYVCTVPQCWVEIQQEQQQRRHPQHLQQQQYGEQHQHTRSWKLQQDSTSWDEHMFELILPKQCTVGHVDLKFSLHPLCTTPPNVQVTLLKQNLCSIGSQQQRHDSSEVDTKIHFRDLSSLGNNTSSDSSMLTEESKASLSDLDAVLASELLGQGAEVVCGPVDLATVVDMSGHCGVLTLTSPQLFSVKAKSFLLHFKAVVKEEAGRESEPSTSTKKESAKEKPSTSSSASEKVKMKGSKNISECERQAIIQSAMRQKLDNLKGCDWMQEISITIRKCKKSQVPKERVQRLAMLENGTFHEQLLLIACGHAEPAVGEASEEHRQKLALDILTWILAVQMNGPTSNSVSGGGGLVGSVQCHLGSLVRSCFLQAGRAIAHQCAKLISLAMEYGKSRMSSNNECGKSAAAAAAASFNMTLLHALLDALPLVPAARSAAAARWFFTLLNRVKGMDVCTTGQMCADMMAQVAQHYHNKQHSQHALLKARFGLYGSPLDTELFDMDLPPILKANLTSSSSSSSTMSYRLSALSDSTSNPSGGGGSSPGDDQDFRDLLALSGSGSSSSSSVGSSSAKANADTLARNICGLLEVEPLHFTCNSTSDSTKLERADTGTNTMSAMVSNETGSINTAGASGGVGTGDSLSSAAGAALASLQKSLAVAEQQLMHKNLQLAKLHHQTHKLEQTLVENSLPSSSAPELIPPPTPKNTPFFMTPPLTPPNESYINHDADPGKPPKVPKGMSSKDAGSSGRGNMQWPASSSMFQSPPPQILVIERMHSGARRFVVLDFGKPVLLTDVIIPASTELASLSIDTWVQGEELDGQRLVVSNDIGLRSLVLNNMMPPAVCRYLKITTIGKYAGGTTKSRIPIGSFFGHSFILPWELASGSEDVIADQPSISQQVSMYIALLEDIQCRYSLAATRLLSLLAEMEQPQSNSAHTHYYLKRGTGSNGGADFGIQQAYSDCIQLQLQMNIAQKAIERLQRATATVGNWEDNNEPEPAMLLKQASVDKLRVLCELLLDSLLSMTYSNVGNVGLPVSLLSAFPPPACEALFRHLCVSGGTRKMQLSGGLLLLRLCANHSWWGDFLGNMLHEFFSLEQPLVFPQDRVFMLLTALGQKSLSGAASSSILESLLTMLAKLLAPLMPGQHRQQQQQTHGQLDLSLIGWLLLFLSKCLDQAFPNPPAEEDKQSKENNSNPSNRWDFIQGDTTLQNSKWSGKTTSARLYRRKLHKKLLHHKQHLMNLQTVKKNFMAAQMEKTSVGGVNKETELLLKQHELLFKQQLKQYSSKHLKDLMNIRRTDGEVLKKLSRDQGSGPDAEGGGSDNMDANAEAEPLLISRDRCIPVVRSLMALLLAMDSTCNVDLFIIASKVLARLCQLARPAVVLSEVMRQEELEHLLLLTCNLEHNHANVSWGGAWAGHTITCLLQDILEGEKLYPAASPSASGGPSSSQLAGAGGGIAELVGVTDDEAAAAALTTEFTDDSLPDTTNLPSMDDDNWSTGSSASEANNNTAPPPAPPAVAAAAPNISAMNKLKILSYKDASVAATEDMIMSMLMDAHGQIPPPEDTAFMSAFKKKGWHMKSMMPDIGDESKKGLLDSWKSRLNINNSNQPGNKTAVSQGVSTAMDARLEFGVELNAEMRLRVMLTLEAVHLQNAMTAPLPPAPHLLCGSAAASQSQTDDDLLLGPSHRPPALPSSSDMLSMCFNNLFTQLPRIDLDSLLLAWLTLDDEACFEVKGEVLFDPTRVPSIPLNAQAMSSLLVALAWAPSPVPVRTWVLSFHTLSLLANLKCGGGGVGAVEQSGSERWLATCMVQDPNIMTVLSKFLSSAASNQVGPTAIRAFTDFLVRLQLRCAEDNESHLKEMLLKLIYTLSADRGAFAACQGPLDAQCRLLEIMVTELSYDAVDVSNAISVIEAITGLLHQHMAVSVRVHTKHNSETSTAARTCFASVGMFSSGTVRGATSTYSNSDSNRDTLMCNLLKLMNVLMEIPLPQQQQQAGRNQRGRATAASSSSVFVDDSSTADSSNQAAAPTAGGSESMAIDSPMTDFSKMSQSLGQQSGVMTSTPNVPGEEQQTDEQKTETAAAQAAAAAQAGNPSSSSLRVASSSRVSRSCTHYMDARQPEQANKEAALADVILARPHIMVQLLQALSHCTSTSTVAMLLAVSFSGGGPSDTLHDPAAMDPQTMGDAIFQLLCTLNRKASDVKLIVRAVYAYISSGFQGQPSAGISKLSEPLLWFILRVLDCDRAISLFLEMGGVEVICNNLVSSSQRVISTSPSLISTVMQHLALNKVSSLARRISTEMDIGGSTSMETMQNFAPLGTISSSSPSAGPADVLIQAAPPHRRARSAAWSYHFYPDEAWVDITITLPCAILLREVQVQPHITSLATCPGAVTIEASRDGITMIPLCSPVTTSGLTCIKVGLVKPEVVSAVTIRLHKPPDSTTIGLTQILLNGHTAFGSELARSSTTSTAAGADDALMARTSLGWMWLLHHCLLLSETCSSQQHQLACAAAASTPNLLTTCTAMLAGPSPSSTQAPSETVADSLTEALYAGANVEAVLLYLGLHTTSMGLKLIDSLLRYTQTESVSSGPSLLLPGKVSGVASAASVELLYQLGVRQDSGSPARLHALCRWLEDSARLALHQHHGAGPAPSEHRLPAPSPAHVHCVATVIWACQEMSVNYDIQQILTTDLLSSLYEWSSVVPVGSQLKRAVDYVLCSLCYVQPAYFSQLLEWSEVRCEALTDDSKEALRGPPLAGDLLLAVDEARLLTLGVACQSPECVDRLLDSGFPAVLCQALYEFCMQQIRYYGGYEEDGDGMGVEGAAMDSDKPDDSKAAESAAAAAAARPSTGGTVVRLSADQVAPVLRFLAEVSKEVKMKEWLGAGGGGQGALFWPVLLHLLCMSPEPVTVTTTQKQSSMSPAHRSAIENATVEFFSQVISCHPNNQHQFALVLCEVIRASGGLAVSGSMGGVGLCGFLRRLFLQVLLEDEKIVLTLRAASTYLSRGRNTSPAHNNTSNNGGGGGVNLGLHHPRVGAGSRHRTLTVSLGNTCGEVMANINDTYSVVHEKKSGAAEKGSGGDDKKKSHKDHIRDALDSISQAAGLSAQEKRDKSHHHSSATPPRPPSRRGYRTAGEANIDTGNGVLSALGTPPALHLSHALIPGQPLPSELTIAQLLTILHERGLEPGQHILHFSMKLKSAKSHVYKADKKTRISAKDAVPARDRVIPEEEAQATAMDELLCDTPALSSALQVFASVGGLALLAEHLPLMYPEISRQACSPDGGATSREAGSGQAGSSAVGHDWVTIESSEDMYEELYEPIPPTSTAVGGSQGGNKLGGAASSQQQQALAAPTVPPHSLVAFGLFLRLPGYAEVLLREKRKARCLLRLVLGVTDDGEGGHILGSSVAGTLATLPFTVLRRLYDSTPLSTDDGVLLRRMTLDVGCLHLVLACLSVLSHHTPRGAQPQSNGSSSAGSQQQQQQGQQQGARQDKQQQQQQMMEGKAPGAPGSNNYWAKGTGFGTGSTISSWDAEQALLRQKSEEQHVACLLQVLASYINPGGENNQQAVMDTSHSMSDEEEESSLLPAALGDLLSQSCLVPAISSYLRNDSVLDMARHIPLYHALLLLLRGLARCPPLMPLLLPLDHCDPTANVSIVALLEKIKTCVDTYASRLKSNKNGGGGKSKNKQEEEECEGLAQLIPDIQETAKIVHTATSKLRQQSAEREESAESERNAAAKADHSLEDKYMDIMKELQFDTFEMVLEDEESGGTMKFCVPHHYEANVKATAGGGGGAGAQSAGRARRLAQEAVTLSTSLPLSYSSSVFVRCDEDRLDVMKVLITGPSETPYSNGCFEFDIFFPQDYPNSPPLVNLETTGNQTVRFNPNLYNDGKVCLSVLNTWHGRPEEKWNTQTSSFLQVLVSIQSLILVSEPYFNEPGYERSRHTPAGQASSREYDANIRQAVVKWAMLETLRNPSKAFKDVIERHFWMKKEEICAQIEEWIQELESHSGDKRTGRTITHSCIALKRHYHQLKEEFAKMKPPADLEVVEEEAAEASAEVPVPAGSPEPSTEPNTEPSTEPAPCADAAEVLVSDTVESAINAAMQSVLTAPQTTTVSADSTSGLVYVDDTNTSKTDAEKSEALAAAAYAQEHAKLLDLAAAGALAKQNHEQLIANMMGNFVPEAQDDVDEEEDEEDEEMQKYL